MINKILVSIFLMVFSAWAMSCEVHLPQNLVILGENADFNLAITQTGCSPQVMLEVNNTLASIEGKMTSFQFAEIMSSKNHVVTVQPNHIQVQHLKHLIREQLLIPPGVQLTSSEAINSPSYFAASPGDKIEVQCIGCLYGTQQPLNINIIAFDGNNKSMMVKADFKKMVKAYRMLSFHTAFSEVANSSLKEEFVEFIPQTELVTNLETLKFYKLNKPVRAGELLRLSDLNAINLVRAGLRTEVIIENDLVKLKTSGISRSNGTLGETVEVFHPQKNKKYQGKVIDINKVLVEL
jgi:flagella basal body P-ring formation protein FlgA